MGEIADRSVNEITDMDTKVREEYPVGYEWSPVMDSVYCYPVHHEWKTLVGRLAHAQCLKHSMEFAADYEALLAVMISEDQFASDIGYREQPTPEERAHLLARIAVHDRRIAMNDEDAASGADDEEDAEAGNGITIPKQLVDVAHRARLAWTDSVQEHVAIGEFGELLALFGKQAQGRATEAQWIDEIADGFIMLTQLATMHGLGDVQARLVEKVAKLEARIQRYRLHAAAIKIDDDVKCTLLTKPVDVIETSIVIVPRDGIQ
jgi:hypothetical protein